MSLLLSTAYAPPIEYFSLLYSLGSGTASVEACEHYVKQSYRNRCHIAGAGGREALTVPVVHRSGEKISIRDVRISDHSHWRHTHISALTTSYGASPFFEYYWDDIHSLIQRPHSHLWELNWELTTLLIQLLDLDVSLEATTTFAPVEELSGDYRYRIRPRQPIIDETFACPAYYQPFTERQGFVSELSVLDLIFNMGPEAPLILRASRKKDPKDK